MSRHLGQSRGIPCLIRLNAGNDVNGNPRRLFVTFQGGLFLNVWDEGHEGSAVLPPELQARAGDAISIPTTPGKYRELLKFRATERHGYAFLPSVARHEAAQQRKIQATSRRLDRFARGMR